jgi:hypothetical protein
VRSARCRASSHCRSYSSSRRWNWSRSALLRRSSFKRRSYSSSSLQLSRGQGRSIIDSLPENSAGPSQPSVKSAVNAGCAEVAKQKRVHVLRGHDGSQSATFFRERVSAAATGWYPPLVLTAESRQSMSVRSRRCGFASSAALELQLAHLTTRSPAYGTDFVCCARRCRRCQWPFDSPRWWPGLCRRRWPDESPRVSSGLANQKSAPGMVRGFTSVQSCVTESGMRERA